jgi:ribosome-associated protein
MFDMVTPVHAGAILPAASTADKSTSTGYACLMQPGVRQTMQEPEYETPEAPSKSRRKRDMHDLQALGEALLGFPDVILGEMGLPEALLEALAIARRITARGGRRRQLQYIGKLMRGIDTAPVRAAIEARRRQHDSHSRAFHRLEKLREALIAEPATALDAVMAEFPAADRHELTRLAHQAHAECASRRPPRAARALFRYLRDLQDEPG